MDLEKAQLTHFFVGTFTRLTKFPQSRVQMSCFNTPFCIRNLPFVNPAGTEAEPALNTSQGAVERKLTPRRAGLHDFSGGESSSTFKQAPCTAESSKVK